MKALSFLVIFLSVFTLNAQEIKWVSLEEAEELQKVNPEKPLFIDVYTDWCGWCKKMDVSTFTDAEVVKKINENYIPVKFDAEQKEVVNFRGQAFEYVEAGNRGINLLAYHLMQGQASYPSYVVLSSEGKITSLLRGYFEAKDFLGYL